MNLYDALKGPLSNKAKYLCKGADFVFNTRSLWRGEGLDGTFTGSLGNGLRRTWKTAVEADISSDTDQFAAWAGLNYVNKTIQRASCSRRKPARVGSARRRSSM